MKEELKNLLRKTVETVLLLAAIYPFGILLRIVFLAWRARKIIRVIHQERFPHSSQGVIIAANHPSMADPFLIGAMCAKGYIRNPFKCRPLFVADKRNFWNSRFWFWLRLILIPVERGNPREEIRAFLGMKKLLKKGEKIVIFPEGGRTCRGKHFFISPARKQPLRTLKTGVGLLALSTGAPVVPIWLEGSDNLMPNLNSKLFSYISLSAKVKIVVGKPVDFSGIEGARSEMAAEATQRIAIALLALADEV